MENAERELRIIIERFADCGWDDLAVPARRFLAGELRRTALREAVERARAACGNCGCALDALYPQALRRL
ncbi:MAG TPA: hypothetical protein IAA75_05140 [Candidatus Pullichristensenella avicola]|nr:hypothetical protein [Candidatus Pullichristensenella avicola]